MIDFIPVLGQPPEIQEKLREMRNAVRDYMYTSHEISAEEHAAWLERLKTDKTQLHMVAFMGSRPIGSANLHRIRWDDKTANWGYYLDTQLTGKGFGIHIARKVLDWAFGELGMEKLNGEAFADNQPSIRNDLKIGMQIEGTDRSTRIVKGQRVDVVHLGITRAEWLAQQSMAA